MWILSKDKRSLYNSDSIDNLYCVSTGVRARFAGAGKDLTLGEYDSSESANQALCLVFKAFYAGTSAYQMPDDERVRAAMIADNPAGKERAADGKKPIRRGGS